MTVVPELQVTELSPNILKRRQLAQKRSQEFANYQKTRENILSIYGAILHGLGVHTGRPFEYLHDPKNLNLVNDYYVAQTMSEKPSREHVIAMTTCRNLLALMKRAGDDVANRIIVPERSNVAVNAKTRKVVVTVELRNEG